MVEVRITRPDSDEPDNDKVIAKGLFGMTPGGLDDIDVHFVALLENRGRCETGIGTGKDSKVGTILGVHKGYGTWR